MKLVNTANGTFKYMWRYDQRRLDQVDLDRNVDGILFMDGDEYAESIAQALPYVFWLGASFRKRRQLL